MTYMRAKFQRLELVTARLLTDVLAAPRLLRSFDPQKHGSSAPEALPVSAPASKPRCVSLL